jgi:hypothetical protein
MPLFSTLKVTVGSGTTAQSFYFRGRATSYNTAISTETGVSAAPTAEQNKALTPVSELVSKGVLIRLAASTGLNKQVKLLCARDKIGTAIDSLEGKTVNSLLIKSVRIPQRATYF